MINLYKLNQKNDATTRDISEEGAADFAPSKLEQKLTDKKKADYKKFIDASGGMTAKQLGWGIWFARHRVVLYRTALLSIIIIGAGFWLFSLWKWVFYFIDFPQAQSVQADLSRFTDYSLVNVRIGFKPVQIYGAEFMPGGADKYDAVAEIFNPNAQSVAVFDYYFSYDNTTTPRQSALLLPGERRPLVAGGILGAAGAPVLSMENIAWHRISPHKVSDPQKWQAEHLNFGVSDFKFVAPSAGGASVSAVQFAFTNNSPYNYKAPNFIVGLYQSDALIGVLPLQFDAFASGEKKDVDLRLYAPGQIVTDVKVFPLINPYDDEAYTQL